MAFAHGKRIWLCKDHYDDWLKEAERNPEMVRQIPGKQVKGITDKGLEIGDWQRQDRRVF